jgi:hypothetical protein
VAGDAHRFLSHADVYFPQCAVTKYNRGKLEILGGTPQAIERGVRLLQAIEPPAQDCHPAEVSWHSDNFDCFTRRDTEVRRILEVENGDALRSIGTLLKKNAQVARNIKEARGDRLWSGQNRRSRAALTAISTGMVMTMYAVMLTGLAPDASAASTKSLLNAHQAIVQHVTEMDGGSAAIAMGAGGLRAMDTLRGAGGLGSGAPEGQELLRCVFGREDILA